MLKVRTGGPLRAVCKPKDVWYGGQYEAFSLETLNYYFSLSLFFFLCFLPVPVNVSQTHSYFRVMACKRG